MTIAFDHAMWQQTNSDASNQRAPLVISAERAFDDAICNFGEQSMQARDAKKFLYWVRYLTAPPEAATADARLLH